VTRPRVIVHVAVSLDGATGGFAPDVAKFYELAATWGEDLTLAGADTILAQEQALASAPRPGPAPDGPLLAVVDGRARVTAWEALRDCGHWSEVVALRAGSTAGGEVEEIVAGADRVDLAGALAALAARRGLRTARVDSGGVLNGALLHAGLVDELSLLVHPVVSGDQRLWYGPAPPPALTLEPLAAESLEAGLVWLRYAVGSPVG
jgi:2,5-diamino-6-(ribosylamino)-4(3H)-pyrimidinone 5'-phosphate reductase